MQCSRRKRVLGRLLLRRQETVNFSLSGVRLGRADHRHLGRFCVHVHRSHDGHTTPCEAPETVESRPCWSIAATLTIQASPLARVQVWNLRTRCNMAWHLLFNVTVDVGLLPWMMVLGSLKHRALTKAAHHMEGPGSCRSQYCRYTLVLFERDTWNEP